MKRLPFLLCLVSFGVHGTRSLASAQPPGHGSGAPWHDQGLYFQCRLDAERDPIAVEVALELSQPLTETELDQVVELPPPLAPIRVTRYLPRAVCQQDCVPDEDEGADPAIELSVDGPTQSYRRWLVANDTERNRLISLIGTWRYMAVADEGQRHELFAQFNNELTGEPKLRISRANGEGSRELPAKPGMVQTLDDLECKIQVRRFYPHFGMDQQINEPANLSNKRLNPAALVEIESHGRKEKRWVFAKFPDFRADKSERLPFQVVLDCPLEPRGDTPDFALVTVGRAGHELWRHEDTKSVSRPVALNERTEIPDSRYTFHIARFVSSGRLVETYLPTDEKAGVAALRIETTDASGDHTVMWLEKGKERNIPTVKGPMIVTFSPRQASSARGHK